MKEYYIVGTYDDGLARTFNGDLHMWGFIDEQGVEVIRCEYDHVLSFHDGYARVRSGLSWGIIDTNGNEIIPCSYRKLSDITIIVVQLIKNQNRIGKLKIII